MAIAFRAFQAGTAGTGTSATCSKPSSPSAIQNNDILIASLYKETFDADFDVPTDWTLIRTTQYYHASGEAELRSYYKRVTDAGSEPSSYTWGGSNGFTSSWHHVHIAAYSGCATSGSPVDADNGTSGIIAGDGSNQPNCSVTTTVANTMLVGHTCYVNGTNLTSPSGMTDRNSGTEDGGNVCDVAQASAGGSGTKAWSGGANGGGLFSDCWCAQLIALKEATSGLTASPTDTATLSENVSVTGAYAPAAVSDTATLSENVSVKGAYAPVLFSDQATVTDNASGATADVSPATGAPLAVFLVEQQL